MNKKTSSTEPVSGKMDNFYGDRSIIMTRHALQRIHANPLISDLYISDIGYYPNALHHIRKRNTGARENILIYCINGCGTIQFDGQSYPIEPYTYFVIPAFQPHKYWASGTDPWSIYWLHFGGEKGKLFKEHFGFPIKIKNSVSSHIDDRVTLFNEILTSLELGFSNNNIELANLSLSRLLASFFYHETYPALKSYNNSVDNAIFFMQRNLHKSIKIQDIATHVHLSSSHLSKIFKNRTGVPPFDYFINLKMQEAIRLLTSKSMRIKEVAFALGYDDPFYFSRLFKKSIGKSPGEFVKTISHKS